MRWSRNRFLFSFSFRLVWVSAVVVLVVIGALLWTSSQNPFWPETGLQAFRQLKALTWTRLGIAAGHEIAVWHAVTHSPNLPPTQVFCGKFFPRFACHLRGWRSGLPRLWWGYVSLVRLAQTWKFLCALMARRHEGPSTVPVPVPVPVQAWAGWAWRGNVLWCHLRLLQCSLRLMFDLVLQWLN